MLLGRWGAIRYVFYGLLVIKWFFSLYGLHLGFPLDSVSNAILSSPILVTVGLKNLSLSNSLF